MGWGNVEPSKRARRALVLAIALHAAAGLALVLSPHRRTTPQVAPPVEVPIEVVTEPVTPDLDQRAHDERVAPTVTERAPSRPAAITSARPVETAPEPAREPIASEGPVSPDAPVALVATARAAAPAIGLALGAPNPFAATGAREQPTSTGPAADDRHVRTAAEAKRAVETALREPARQRERELGLGPEGPVLQALGDATTASTAPVKGRAVFRAVADGAGMIVGIEVVECDGGRPGWANAAELARAALRGKKLRMPTTATGAELRIEIVSEWKLPSGHDPGTNVSMLGVPVAKGEGKKSTTVDILDPIPKIAMVELAPGLKVPVPQLTVTIIAVHGDPADLGARPRRVVHTKLIESKVL